MPTVTAKNQNKRKAIGGGAYIEDCDPPRYWERIRRKTWRLLRNVTTKREAIRLASSRNPEVVSGSFARLAELYILDHCPNGALKPKVGVSLAEEIWRTRKLTEFFGPQKLDKMASITVIPDYHKWRLARLKRRGHPNQGARTVDKETQTLSNVFRYAVITKLFPTNPFSEHRPRYQDAAQVRHSRERAPQSADVIHQVVRQLFNQPDTESAGWFCFFAMFSSCRISELLRLRTDAKDPAYPGYIQWAKKPLPDRPLGLLHLGEKKNAGGRSKGGINPEILIGSEFAQMLKCFQRWHQERFPKSPWYFPSTTGQASSRRVISRQITAACAAIGIPAISPHGFRSFYVTKRRSDGASEAVIAGELGDQTIALMQTTYGKRPPNWLDGDALSWLPSEGLAEWQRWRPLDEKVTALT